MGGGGRLSRKMHANPGKWKIKSIVPDLSEKIMAFMLLLIYQNEFLWSKGKPLLQNDNC